MTIGLKRGTVKLARHKSTWSKSFQSEKLKLNKTLGSAVVDIQHIGSSSIKKIKAKPVIDIAIGLNKIPSRKILDKLLTNLGYSYRANASQKGTHLFFAKGPESKRTHYLHISKYGGKRWKSDLKFRDVLNSDPALAKKYDDLKQSLAKKFANDRKSYTREKDSFIKRVLKN